MLQLAINKEFNSEKLSLQGNIPSWLNGTLFRNGPVLYTIDGKFPVHWFDGLGMLHAFNIEKGQVYYTNKYLQSEALKNPPHYLGFACDPCYAIFKKIFASFLTNTIHNANVNIAKYADSLVGITETPLPVIFDSKTLATQGVYDFTDSLPKDNVFESAHPHYNPLTGENINYIVRYGLNSSYQVYSLYEKSRKLLFEYPVKNPAYMHTFSLTENFIIFTEYPFKVNPLAILLSGKPFILNYKWQKNSPTRFIILDRQTGKLHSEYETFSFFSFHHVNAYEQDKRIIIDLIAYPDASIIATLGKYGQPQYVPSVDQALAATKLLRFTLDEGEYTVQNLFEGAIEFPRINPSYDGLPYRYFYSADIRESLGNTIYKMDFETKQMISWQDQQCSPGEPVFIPNPHETKEDAGVIASVLLNKSKGGSELLLLEASTFQEIARATIPIKIPLGLHGQFYGN